jgi:glutaminyl-tRNA synthetase
VKGTCHWVSAAHAVNAEVRLYDRLFVKENPLEGKGDFREHINPDSLETLTKCRVEPSLATAEKGSSYQFERVGYFCVDSVDSSPGHLVFNRTIGLRDTWAKIERTQKGR